MSIEKSRESQVLKIHKKDDKETFVRLKIISEITFVDPDEQYQETIYKFDNSHNSSREITVADVEGLPVEQIIKFNMKDAISEGQEFIYSLLTNPKVHKTTHATKIYRYENGVKDENTWIKVERIDELRVIDPADQFQETIFKLKWPDLEIDGWDENGSGGEFCEFPIRLDPFQNIIDAQFENRGFALIVIDARNNDFPFPSVPEMAAQWDGVKFWWATMAPQTMVAPNKEFYDKKGNHIIWGGYIWDGAVIFPDTSQPVYYLIVDIAKLKSRNISIPIYGANWQVTMYYPPGTEAGWQDTWLVPTNATVKIYKAKSLKEAADAYDGYLINDGVSLPLIFSAFATYSARMPGFHIAESGIPYDPEKIAWTWGCVAWGEQSMVQFTTVSYDNKLNRWRVS